MAASGPLHQNCIRESHIVILDSEAKKEAVQPYGCVLQLPMALHIMCERRVDVIHRDARENSLLQLTKMWCSQFGLRVSGKMRRRGGRKRNKRSAWDRRRRRDGTTELGCIQRCLVDLRRGRRERGRIRSLNEEFIEDPKMAV